MCAGNELVERVVYLFSYIFDKGWLLVCSNQAG